MESVECLQSKINSLLERHSLVASVDRTYAMTSSSENIYMFLTINIEDAESGERLDTFEMIRPFEGGYDNSSYQEFLEEVYDTYLKNWVVGKYKKELSKK